MSRFDRPSRAAATAKAVDAQATAQRAQNGSGPRTKQATLPKNTPSRAEQNPERQTSVPKKYQIRLHVTLDESDPVGAMLSQHYADLPEGQRQYFDPNKIFRTALLNSLPDLAKKM